MAQKDPILKTETAKVGWSILLQSPHAMAYKIWTKEPEGEWVVIKEGGMSDDKIDAGEFIAKRGDHFAYWFAFGSTKPNSKFNASLVLTQENAIIENGILQEKGSVDDEGIFQKTVTVTLK